MWTWQKLMWFAFWRKMPWGQSFNLCAFVKQNKRRKYRKCDFTPVAACYFNAVAASKSPSVNRFEPEDCHNLMLVAPNNKDYLVHVKKIIDAFHAKRAKNYVPRTPSSLYFASKMMECIVRTCYGLGYARIIQYDTPAGQTLERTYLECDVIRSDAASATVFVGEIKAHALNRPTVAAQLQARCKILATSFKHVIPIAIGITMSSMEKTQDLLHPTLRAVTRKGFLYLNIALTLKDVLDYAAETRMQYDEKIISDAHAEAKELAAKQSIKNNNKTTKKQ
jgi:hypothetical protein